MRETQKHCVVPLSAAKSRRLSKESFTHQQFNQSSFMGSRKRERNSFEVRVTEDDKEELIISNVALSESKRLSIASLLNTSGAHTWEDESTTSNNNQNAEDLLSKIQPSSDSSLANLVGLKSSSCPMTPEASLSGTTTTQLPSTITNLPSFDNLLANLERLHATFLPILPPPCTNSYNISPAGSPYPSPRPLEIFRNQNNNNQPLEEVATVFLELSKQQRIVEQPIEDNNTNNQTSETPKRVNALLSNWMVHFKELKDFKQKFGHTNVTRTTDEWKNLGNWVAAQRKRMRKGKLPKQQFELLSSLGFEWDRSYYFQRTDTKRLKKDEQ